MNKIKSFFLITTLGLGCGMVHAQNIFNIQDVIERAHQQSPASKRAETQRETSYWQYRSFRASYNPQLLLSGNLPSYQYGNSGVVQNNGTVKYYLLNQAGPIMNLGLVQPVRWTGGQISANTSLNYFKNIASSDDIWNGTVMNVQLTQPLFAFNPYKWTRKVQPIVFEESKRSYVEQKEYISREVVNRFFEVLRAQINLQISTFNLANNDTIYKIEQGRYNIGTTSLDKLLQVELQLLRSRQEVAQAKLDLQTGRLQLRTFIGLKDGEEFRLIMPEEVPQFDVSVDDALSYAKLNRADYIAFERRRIEADRDVAQAKGSRYETNLTASFGLNSTAQKANEIYIAPKQQKNMNIGLTIPVLNWGRNHATMQTALANKRLVDYTIAQDEINFEQTIITKVSQFEMLRLQIEITKKSDAVAQERYNVAQNRYLIGKIDITNLNIALTEKDAAKRSYIDALKSFWTSYYDLRGLTLYDFYTKQLLYKTEE